MVSSRIENVSGGNTDMVSVYLSITCKHSYVVCVVIAHISVVGIRYSELCVTVGDALRSLCWHGDVGPAPCKVVSIHKCWR